MGRQVYYRVTLSKEERKQLRDILRKGKHSSQKVLNPLILLNYDEGSESDGILKNNKDIASYLQVSERKIDRIRKRFVEEDFDVAVNVHKTTREYKRKTDGEFEAHLVALCCSDSPEGYAHWTLRLLADKVVELDYIDKISHETIRRFLKKTNLSLGEKKDG